MMTVDAFLVQVRAVAAVEPPARFPKMSTEIDVLEVDVLGVPG